MGAIPWVLIVVALVVLAGVCRRRLAHSASGLRALADIGVSSGRCRARQLGMSFGTLPCGKYNAITDVPGVLVGHTTLVVGAGQLIAGQGPVRTGVTAILPHGGDIWNDRVTGAVYVHHGNGEVTGAHRVNQSGYFETPIVLTNTVSVGTAVTALHAWMDRRYKIENDVCVPAVAECYDGVLNDIHGAHVKENHVMAALDGALGGPVAEGCVGAGTGMWCYQFKGGIGTASRLVQCGASTYTVGVLVNCNHGRRDQLIFGGVPIGTMLPCDDPSAQRREGSIIMVVATDAPLGSERLKQLAKRAVHGLALTGSTANENSGDFVLAFSTTRRAPRKPEGDELTLREVSPERLDGLFQSAAEATEEAILNALCMAETTTGRDNKVVPALPLDKVRRLLAQHGRVK